MCAAQPCRYSTRRKALLPMCERKNKYHQMGGERAAELRKAVNCKNDLILFATASERTRPQRDVSTRLLRRDRRRCGVSESSALPRSRLLHVNRGRVLHIACLRRAIRSCARLHLGAWTHQDANSYALVRVNAPCKHNFTERESSPASRSSAVCRIPGVRAAQRRAGAERRALEQLLCRGD